jgi:cytoskeletal protein RodZ
MPIFRYFSFVGGALLALLFAANYVLPTSPVTQAVATASNEQPLIRIRSDRHLPERVVLDTSQPTLAAPAVKVAAVVAPQPPVEGMSPALAEISAKARVRETFAQFTPAAKADTAAVKKTEAKTQIQPQVQAQAQPPQTSAQQPKRKVARTHPVPQQGRPMMVMAQQPHFGFFNSTW